MRQTDCLSLTENYYQKDISFWQPEIQNHFLDDGLSGKSAAEFPIMYYFVGQLWKIFGKSEALFRMLNLGILVIGLVMLFETTKKLLNDSYLAGFISLVLFSSPMLVFYSMNFMPNGPSLGLVFIAWFFVLRHYRTQKNYFSWLAILFFSLGILIKIDAAISFIALIGWLIFEKLFVSDENRLTRINVIYIVQSALVVTLTVGWYLYAEYYNNLHKGSFSFHGIWPIWEMSSELYRKIEENIRVIFFKDYFLPIVQYLTALLFLVVLLMWKKLKTIEKYFLIILPVGGLMYLALWFQVLEAHDYYLINLLAILALCWFLFFRVIENKPLIIRVLYPFLFVLLIYSSWHCEKQLNERQKGWMNDWYMTKLEAVTELQPIFEQYGIKKDDLVISIPDMTVCSSLYLMDRSGYTEFASDFSKDEIFKKRISQGAKYLIVNDTTILGKEVLQPYIQKEIAVHKNVHIYDLRGIE
jgi:hypothetical protein